MSETRLKLAVQKKGRLTDKTLDLLRKCGIDFENGTDRLYVPARNFPIDLLFLRDDDIPEYVQDAVADIGVVGKNESVENRADVEYLKDLGYSRCKLMMAGPEKSSISTPVELDGKTIATSYPNLTKDFLASNGISCKVVEISGSVEISTSLGIADFICDLVSTGTTLRMNHLKPLFNVFESEAVLIGSKKNNDDPEKSSLIEELLKRMNSVQNAKNSKYLMMNMPNESLEKALEILPSLKSPTILPLADGNSSAVHAVIPSNQFWNIIEDLKSIGASGILLLPIDNIVL